MNPGQKVVINGIEYVVKRTKKERCKGCAGVGKPELCRALPYCGDIVDEKCYIIFVKA
jgi:hypothetical protein